MGLVVSKCSYLVATTIGYTIPDNDTSTHFFIRYAPSGNYCVQLEAQNHSKFFVSFVHLKDMFKRISCEHIKTGEATAMLSVSEIVAKTEAIFDLFNHHFYSSELTNLGFAFAALDGFTRRKILTCNFSTQE